MKVKLNGIDRISIPEILRRVNIEGNELEIITVREVKKEVIEIVAIKEEEFAEYGITMDPDGSVFWDLVKIETEKEFDLKKPHTELLKQARRVLNDNRRVNDRIVDTCLKIEKMR